MTTYVINGIPYSFDGSSPRDLSNGGHKQWFPALLGDLLIAMDTALNAEVFALAAAASAASAASTAAGYTATSATSLTVVAGVKNLTASTGKQFTANSDVVIFRTAAPANRMYGRVDSYDSGTGAMQVTVATIEGGGTFTDWTIVLAGQRGASGVPTGIARNPQSGAYTVLATDSGKFIDLSGTTYTVGFQACATLAADSWFIFRNLGTGVVTLDPNGSEQINGALTYALAPGHTVLVQCDGTALRVVHDIGIKQTRYPIFDARTVGMDHVSCLELMENSLPASGLTGGTGMVQLTYGASLFVGATGATSGNVASSPDGETWTLRAMPSSAAWSIGSDGTGFVATVPGATTTATSANGTSWSSATALPGAAKATYGIPVFLGTTAFVLSTTTTSAYTSTNYGTSWSTVTLPAASGSIAPFVVGGLLWYHNSGTTAYTSATGATASWTARTLPVTFNEVWQDFDGALIGVASGGTVFYRTTDGINWSAMSVSALASSSTVRTINSVYVCFSTTFGAAATWHKTSWIRRTSFLVDSRTSYFRCAKNPGSTIFLVPHNGGSTGQVGRIAPTESTAATALFEG